MQQVGVGKKKPAGAKQGNAPAGKKPGGVVGSARQQAKFSSVHRQCWAR